MKKRESWLDALRILCAFLVIVNHTNSGVFQSASPQEGVWWFSAAWYVLSKIAVPVFVLVSGACLLGREDGYRRCFGRFLRIVGALTLFSYGYFLYDAWVYYGLFPRMLDWRAFLSLMWTEGITDGFWYLYFYAALMLALPILQRLSCAMRGRDGLYLCGLCFGFGALWPLLESIWPACKLPEHFALPFCSTYLGLFFAGFLLRGRKAPSTGQRRLAGAVLALSLAGNVLLLYRGYAPNAKYWLFMDARMQPSFLTVLAALSAAVLLRGWLNRPLSVRAQGLWAELGGCAFGIYLMQDWLIAQTKERLYLPLCGALSPFPAVLVWELFVFALALCIAYLMRKLPLLKKLL